MISNVKIIIGALTSLAAMFFYVFKKGEQSEKNKSYKRAVKVVQKNKKIRKELAKLSRADKLKRL